MNATVALPARAPLALGRPLARAAGWTAIGALTALLVVNTLPYFADADAMPFFEEKGSLPDDPIWRAAFFVHITGGMACLVAALPLFSKRLLAARPAVHRALGWAYVASVLLLVVPTGLFLSPTARGQTAGPAGFMVIGLSLLVCTAMGLRHVLRRDFVAHRAWMVRSYAMAATALSFRVVFVVLSRIPVARAYEISVWLSWGIAALVAEAWIERSRTRTRRTTA